MHLSIFLIYFVNKIYTTFNFIHVKKKKKKKIKEGMLVSLQIFEIRSQEFELFLFHTEGI